MGTRNALKDERLRGKLSFFETLILNFFHLQGSLMA